VFVVFVVAAATAVVVYTCNAFLLDQGAVSLKFLFLSQLIDCLKIYIFEEISIHILQLMLPIKESVVSLKHWLSYLPSQIALKYQTYFMNDSLNIILPI